MVNEKGPQHTEKRDGVGTSQLQKYHHGRGKHRSMEHSLGSHLKDLTERPFARKLQGYLHGLNLCVYDGIVRLHILQGC